MHSFALVFACFIFSVYAVQPAQQVVVQENVPTEPQSRHPIRTQLSELTLDGKALAEYEQTKREEVEGNDLVKALQDPTKYIVHMPPTQTRLMGEVAVKLQTLRRRAGDASKGRRDPLRASCDQAWLRRNEAHWTGRRAASKAVLDAHFKAWARASGVYPDRLHIHAPRENLMVLEGYLRHRHHNTLVEHLRKHGQRQALAYRLALDMLFAALARTEGVDPGTVVDFAVIGPDMSVMPTAPTMRGTKPYLALHMTYPPLLPAHLLLEAKRAKLVAVVSAIQNDAVTHSVLPPVQTAHTSTELDAARTALENAVNTHLSRLAKLRFGATKRIGALRAQWRDFAELATFDAEYARYHVYDFLKAVYNSSLESCEQAHVNRDIDEQMWPSIPEI